MTHSSGSPRECQLTTEDAGLVDLPDLMREVQGGSADALQELMDRLWTELVRFAAWELGDPELAEDMVQDAFVYVWEHRLSWTHSGSPRAFLYRIVRHHIIDERRRMRVRAELAERRKFQPFVGPPTPAEMFEATMVREAFEEAVSALPVRRREVFYLVVFRGLPHREAAEILDISQQTVANQVSAALGGIRAAIRAVSEKPL